MIKKALIFAVMLMLAACSTKYAQLNNKIDKAVTPGDIIGVSIDISMADISSEKKKKLSVKLVKKAVNIFKLYIEFAINKGDVPNKDEITDMLKFLADNMESLTDSDIYEQAKIIAEKLTEILLEVYFEKGIGR